MADFFYNGREYRGFDLDNQESVNVLLADGVPPEFINALKNSPQPPTPEERLEALENSLLLLLMEG